MLQPYLEVYSSTRTPKMKEVLQIVVLLVACNRSTWFQNNIGAAKGPRLMNVGSLLKEAVEDLEWVAGGGSMTLTIQRDPPSISISAISTGSLEVRLPVSHP